MTTFYCLTKHTFVSGHHCDMTARSCRMLKKMLLPLNMLLYTLAAVTVLSSPSWAEPRISITVKTVLASETAQTSGPGLSSALIDELRSLFRYSSYRLLSENQINLDIRKTGAVSLPDNRVLKVTPTGVSGERVELELVILKNKKQIFQTVVQLLNRGSIIVGGPKHKDGSLLFNISASF